MVSKMLSDHNVFFSTESLSGWKYTGHIQHHHHKMFSQMFYIMVVPHPLSSSLIYPITPSNQGGLGHTHALFIQLILQKKLY